MASFDDVQREYDQAEPDEPDLQEYTVLVREIMINDHVVLVEAETKAQARELAEEEALDTPEKGNMVRWTAKAYRVEEGWQEDV